MEIVPFALLAEKNNLFSYHKLIQQLYKELKVTFSNYVHFHKKQQKKSVL